MFNFDMCFYTTLMAIALIIIDRRPETMFNFDICFYTTLMVIVLFIIVSRHV